VYRELGRELGLAFQMVDDVVDVAGDPETARKSLRTDLANGTVTLPMVHAAELRPEHPAIEAFAAAADVDAGAQEALAELLASEEVLRACSASIDRHADAALAALERLPSNAYAMGLADLVDYVRRGRWGGLG
ncbi:MAG: polyprenyl synthetase family protein, partial [Actinomycetota bacterium]|nr:polyprenyl synthetase family protein [Actinomycetota bacterium]